ncbi:MAG TPA: YajD family HNH nuclease [Syntrophales bacterium]|nr:YajD family HNH nuclease [Syntrophales bacterium]
MARMSFGKKGNRVRTTVAGTRPAGEKPVEQVVRELKEGMQRPPGEDYRERSLAIHGLICARCTREFDATNRHLLTVHHRDGNHHNNPPDGSNWENLCVYCHDDVHSRGLLGDYYGGRGARERHLVRSSTEGAEPGRSGFGEKLRRALEKKEKKGK